MLALRPIATSDRFMPLWQILFDGYVVAETMSNRDAHAWLAWYQVHGVHHAS